MTVGSFWRSEPAPESRGIGIEREPGLLALGVDPRELRLGHEHLAADVDRGGLGEAVRDRPDRAQVGAHVLAGGAVAPRGALHETAALVAQGDGQAVDLELGHVAQLRRRLRGRRQAESAADPRVERPQFVVAERVGQAEHRPPMADLGEDLAGRGAADPLGR